MRRALAAGTVLTMLVGLPAALISAGAARAAGSAPVWQVADASQSPAGGVSGSTVFDPATGQVLLVGQDAVQNCPAPLTWTWDGSVWSVHKQLLAPPLRESPTLGYDGATREVVSFGGSAYSPMCLGSGADLLETWTWNGSVWTQQHPATSPGRGGCAAYDANTGQFILFGGANANETWQWTGVEWKQLAPASSPQASDENFGQCSMTYDATRKVLMLLVADPNTIDDMWIWTWDGTNWNRSADLPAPALAQGVHVVPPINYDADTGEDVVFVGLTGPCEPVGGSHSETCTETDQTWSWDGSAWSQSTAAGSPKPGISYTASYDAATRQLVMFNGQPNSGPEVDSIDSPTTWLYSSRGSSSVSPVRLAGADRQSTAAAVSTSAFAASGSASSVVLARADQFADALAGGPLAAAKHAPLLLTSSGSLDAVTKAEIGRVLPAGGTVYLLGGTSALSAAVANAVVALGDLPVRISGADRYDTAVAIAGVLGNPTTVFEASGVNFPDALSAVPAAVSTHGAILLTNSAATVAVTKTYLAAHATTRYAIGGPAAYADPTAIGIAGADRYATSEAVALAFFPATTGASLASAANYPDALAGGPVAGIANHPVLLVPPTGALPEPIAAYLKTHAGDITTIQAFGGTNALDATVVMAVADSLH
jgi:putative cell wall-binding protein